MAEPTSKRDRRLIAAPEINAMLAEIFIEVLAKPLYAVFRLLWTLLAILLAIPCAAIAGIIARDLPSLAREWQTGARATTAILLVMFVAVLLFHGLSSPWYWTALACVAAAALACGCMAEYLIIRRAFADDRSNIK